MTKKTLDGKYQKIMGGIGLWTSFYWANPHRLVLDYFGFHWLRPLHQVYSREYLRHIPASKIIYSSF